jgi:hypothetical protein
MTQHNNLRGRRGVTIRSVTGPLTVETSVGDGYGGNSAIRLSPASCSRLEHHVGLETNIDRVTTYIV